MTPRRLRFGTAAAAALALFATVCGTRLDHATITAATASPKDPAASAGSGLLPSSASSPLTPALEGSTPGDRATAEATHSRASVERTQTPAQSGDRVALATSSGTGPEGPKSAITIGAVGTMSGPTGYTGVNGVAAVQVWVRMINDRGGLHGHPVRYLAADDQSDPARHRALVQDLVERRGVVAFVFNVEELGGKGSVGYITQRRVPVIGSLLGAGWFYESPMYFPQGSAHLESAYGALAALAGQARVQGKKKFASIACAEAANCDQWAKEWATKAKDFGLDVVYQAKASIAQPDYTAECLNARSAGAEMLEVLMTASNVGQVARACARQNYHPLIGISSSTLSAFQEDDPNLQGMVAGLNVFPFFVEDTPATREFHEAMRRYAPRAEIDNNAATAWVSAKLFERAATNVADPTSSAAILAGLWSVRADDLGGLTQALTFTKGRTAPRQACWIVATIEHRQLVAKQRKMSLPAVTTLRLPTRGAGTIRAGRDVRREPVAGPARIAAEVYTSEERFEAERDRLFRHAWFVVGRVSELPGPGDYLVWEEFGETVVICRQGDGTLAAFHNVCQHRGARIVTSSGFCPQLFTCPWHGFRYDRAGLVRGVPDRGDFDAAELAGLRAPKVAVEAWGGWIWIYLDGDRAPTLEEWLGPEIVEELGHYQMENMVVHRTRVWDMPVNWKVVVEGFIEVYHVAALHRRSIGSALVPSETFQWLFDRHSMYVVPFRDQLETLYVMQDHIHDAICHYLVFPNSIFNANPTHIQFFMPVPIDAHTSKYKAWNLILPGGDKEYQQSMDDQWDNFCEVAGEDLFAATQVGSTRRSLGYSRNLTNRRECRIPHFLDAVDKALAT